MKNSKGQAPAAMEMSVLCVLAGLAVLIHDSAAAVITPALGTVCGKVGGTAEFPWTFPDATLGMDWFKGPDTTSSYIMDFITSSGAKSYGTGYDSGRIEPFGANNVGMKLLNLVSGDPGPYTVRVTPAAGAAPTPVTATLKIIDGTAYENGITYTAAQGGTESTTCPTGDFTITVNFEGDSDCAGHTSSTCNFKGNAVTASSAHTYVITNAQTGDVITMVGELSGSGITKSLSCTVKEGGGGGCEIGCGCGIGCIIGIVIGNLCLCGIVGVAVYRCKRSKKGGL